MPIKKLTKEQINLLIEIIPLVNEKAINTIVPVLSKMRDGEDLNEEDEKHIKDWGVAPEGGGYRAAKALTYIVIKYFS